MRQVPNSFKQKKNAQIVKFIFLYEINYTGSSWLRYASWPSNVDFDGNTYIKYPIKHSGITENSAGQIDKVTLTIANVDRIIQSYIENYDGMKEKEVRIKMVWSDDLADTSNYIEDIFHIEKVQVNERIAQFTLASKLDVLDLKLPKRRFFREYCQWIFKSTQCGYSGAESQCNKTFTRCKELNNFSRFGGFPSIPRKHLFIGGGG